MQPAEIKSAWLELISDMERREQSGSEVPSRPTNTITSAGPIRLAISGGGLCSLLIPTSRPEIAEQDSKSELISVHLVTLSVRGTLAYFVDVRCEEKKLIDVFAKVVSDVLDRIEAGASSLGALDEALTEFRRLLHKPRTPSVDELLITGLIGELLTLIEALKFSRMALTAWHGPHSDRHDFRAGSISVEVKTSLGADGRNVHINGIRQLEIDEQDRLLVRHVRIEPDPVGPLSVPALVGEIGSMVDDRILLQRKLEKLGYLPDYEESWRSIRFRYVGAEAYDVCEGFPRLTTSSLSVVWPLPGVSAVSYELDLGAASSFLVDDSEWSVALEEMCLCL